MKIKIKELGDIAIKNKKYLNEFLVRFQYKQKKRLIKIYSMILKGDNDTRKLFPDAPNREAVKYNLEHSIKGFEKAFLESKNARFVTEGIIKNFRDLLKKNISHVYNPTYIYTNGQKIATVVKIGRLFETVLHKDRLFFEFFSEYNRDISFDVYELKRFDSLITAETEIRKLLSELNFKTFLASKGNVEKKVLLQPCFGSGGIVYFNGKELCPNITHQRFIPAEEYVTLNNLNNKLESYHIKCCATCKNFMFSGMSRDMSSGLVGYCKNRMGKSPKTKMVKKIRGVSHLNNSLVSVSDLCDKYSFILDKDRKYPYLAENQNKNKDKKLL